MHCRWPTDIKRDKFCLQRTHSDNYSPENTDAQCFAVLADEITDITTTEQASICVRYIATVNETLVVEGFLEFVPVHNVTGNGIARTILDALRGK